MENITLMQDSTTMITLNHIIHNCDILQKTIGIKPYETESDGDMNLIIIPIKYCQYCGKKIIQ